jgi:hypothetical protein
VTALKVTLVIDECDADLVQVTQGYVQVAPSARIPDPADGAIIGQAPVTAAFSAGGPPQVELAGTDQVGPQPDGWTYEITYYHVPGIPLGWSWSFYLPYAGGATQRLSDLAQVPAAQPGQQYVPLPPAPASPPSAGDVLTVVGVNPLVMAWQPGAAGTDGGSAVTGQLPVDVIDGGSAATGQYPVYALDGGNA